MHRVIGLFVGPWILVSAMTGLAYIASLQIEAVWYQAWLTLDHPAPATARALPLSEQVAAAGAALGTSRPLQAVRPAPDAETTTRVMFDDPAFGGHHRAGPYS